MNSLLQEKKRLRKKIIDARAELPEEYCINADQIITSRVLELEAYRRAKTVFCYIGMEGEIATMPLIHQAWACGKRVFTPRCIGRGVMEAFEIRQETDLEMGKFRIWEPKEDCIRIDPKDIDIAIIPCLSCDKHGIRLGYGGGYYDRYLTDAVFKTVVLCRSVFLCELLPSESHDVPMDYIITEKDTRLGLMV